MKWATPVWLLICVVTIAINHAAEAKVLLSNLIIALAAAYPLTAFIFKATAEDVAKWRSARKTKSKEGASVGNPPETDLPPGRRPPLRKNIR